MRNEDKLNIQLSRKACRTKVVDQYTFIALFEP